MLRTLLAAVTAACLTGCFSPDYGDTPFWCTLDDPTCPEGYSCAVDSASVPYPTSPERRLCVRKAGSSNNGGSCLDDDLEDPPNDSPQTATSLDSSLLNNPGVSLYGLEICTSDDVDFYSFTVAAASVVAATVQYQRDQGELSASILDSALNEVALGAPLPAGLRVEGQLNPGLYYLKVAAGPGGTTNIYDFSLTISPSQ